MDPAAVMLADGRETSTIAQRSARNCWLSRLPSSTSVTSLVKPSSLLLIMDAKRDGVNTTTIMLSYFPSSPNDRALILTILRPGRNPTDEAQIAINDLLDASRRLMSMNRDDDGSGL